MKKIILLVFTFAIAGTLMAQSYPQQRDSRRVILGEDRPVYGNGGSYGSYPSSTPGNKRDRKIAQVNREYELKIRQVNNDSYLNRGQKRREVRKLEKQRDKEVKKINKRYSRKSIFNRNIL